MSKPLREAFSLPRAEREIRTIVELFDVLVVGPLHVEMGHPERPLYDLALRTHDDLRRALEDFLFVVHEIEEGNAPSKSKK